MSDSVKSKRIVRRACLGGVALAGGAALLITSLPALASDTSDAPEVRENACEIEVLPGDADADQGRVTAIDETATHIGGFTRGTGADIPVMWQDGEPVEITFPDVDDAVSQSVITGINTDGLAVGWVYFKVGATQKAFTAVDGEATILPLPEGYVQSSALDVNADGSIVGDIGTVHEEWEPAVWESPEAEPTPLSIPDDAVEGVARGINDEGHIVGRHRDDSRTFTAYQWDAEGNGTELPTSADNAMGIAGDWISGTTPAREGMNTAVRWNGDEAEEIELGYLFDINAQGDVLGDSTPASTSTRAAKYTADGKLYVLPFPETATQSRAETVSADGLTIGGGVEPENGTEGHWIPVLWHCEE